MSSLLDNPINQTTARQEPALQGVLRLLAKAMVRKWFPREIKPPHPTHVPSSIRRELGGCKLN
jgi:hypothetical protein